ncbi:MAG: hypothetical protein DHS20C05_14700 [Hyphococcus sp.]|nr:MAG: hypothetical protein DHS20C05_14700 [Marinicaulis sp.]
MKLGISGDNERDSQRSQDMLDFTEAAPAPSGVAAMLGTKNLLIIIVTMPFVFLVVVMTIIGIFGRPGADEDRTVEAATTSVRSTAVETLEEPSVAGQRVILPVTASTGDLSSAIALPAGAQAGAISLDGDRLAVRIDTDDGAMVVIYDLAKGAAVQTIPLTSGSTN